MNRVYENKNNGQKKFRIINGFGINKEIFRIKFTNFIQITELINPENFRLDRMQTG
jgi:hypothetical protein